MIPNKIILKILNANRVGRLFKLRGGRILYFHSINPNHPMGLPPEKFRFLIKKILEMKKEIITIEEMAERIRRNQSVENCISISFDDGYEDNYIYALPIIMEFSIRATFFIIAGIIRNQKKDQDLKIFNLYHNLRLISKEQLIEISNYGMEIGSHGLTHIFMKKEPYETVKREILLSKYYLEDIIGKPVVSFAFPNGEIKPGSLFFLKKAGYRQAVTTNWDCVSINNDIYNLPRQIIDHYLNETDITDLLEGKYDFMKYVQLIKKRCKK